MPLKFLEPVSSAMADRLRNPIYGTFILTWLATNWNRIFLLFFSEEKAEVRIAQFWNSLDFWNGLFAPTLFAAFLLLVMPWLAAALEFTNRKVKNWRVDLRLEHRRHEVGKEIELASEEWKLASIKSGNAEYEELTSRCAELQRTIDELENILAGFTEIGASPEQVKKGLEAEREHHQSVLKMVNDQSDELVKVLGILRSDENEKVSREHWDMLSRVAIGLKNMVDYEIKRTASY
ncbi:hypothetical protein [Maritalea sp. S77]|uniref:hypothetical protein n=1 Tax=Maritalea sp. S77 TaxID=3415125 RepID=UPI003C7C28B5